MANSPGVWRCSLLQRCPRCGKGALFAGLLNVVPECAQCRLKLAEHEKGDGPAFFAIVLVGFLATGLATWLELAFSPPAWVHLAVWPPVIIALSLYSLRVFKAALIAMQFRHRPQDFS